jgi:hypothetical protein
VAEPTRGVGGVRRIPSPEPPPSSLAWRYRARRALGGWARAALAWATRPARLLPGLAAVGCAVAGTWLLWGLGWGLLVAAAFLLALDLRIPRA